jgi:hypothetical protein
MSKGYFTDKHISPTENEIHQVIGFSKNNWDLLNHYHANELKLKGEFKFYGVNYGWALGYNKSGNSLIALYPDMDSFMVQIILNKNQVEAALTQVTN